VHTTKVGFRHARLMSWETAEDDLYAKLDQAVHFDGEARERADTFAGLFAARCFSGGPGHR
jgi:trans-feruloyl-CoA hydratase/vanillin synthase